MSEETRGKIQCDAVVIKAEPAAVAFEIQIDGENLGVAVFAPNIRAALDIIEAQAPGKTILSIRVLRSKVVRS